MWYRFTADNRETLYGWTETKAVAEAAAAHLDRLDERKRREFGLYGMECLGEEWDDVGQGRPMPLTELLFDEDATVEDYDAAAAADEQADRERDEERQQDAARAELDPDITVDDLAGLSAVADDCVRYGSFGRDVDVADFREAFRVSPEIADEQIVAAFKAATDAA